MKQLLSQISRPILRASLKETMRRESMSPAMREFAAAFPELQELRHAADYDPAATFGALEVRSIIETAANAMAAFDRCPQTERTNVLALLLAGARA